MSKYFFILLRLFLFSYLILAESLEAQAPRQNWRGVFNGKNDTTRLLTSGTDVLVVKRAYIWDNGEGKSPTGKGSNYAWYGIKHGPYGNIHMVIYAPNQKTELVHTLLHGPWKTGNSKWEWLDNEGLEYVNYGIYNWNDFGYDRIYILIYESDPKDIKGIPIGFLRKHDTLMTLQVDRDRSYGGLTYNSYNIPILELQTVDLSGSRP